MIPSHLNIRSIFCVFLCLDISHASSLLSALNCVPGWAEIGHFALYFNVWDDVQNSHFSLLFLLKECLMTVKTWMWLWIQNCMYWKLSSRQSVLRAILISVGNQYDTTRLSTRTDQDRCQWMSVCIMRECGQLNTFLLSQSWPSIVPVFCCSSVFTSSSNLSGLNKTPVGW